MKGNLFLSVSGIILAELSPHPARLFLCILYLLRLPHPSAALQYQCRSSHQPPIIVPPYPYIHPIHALPCLAHHPHHHHSKSLPPPYPPLRVPASPPRCPMPWYLASRAHYLHSGLLIPCKDRPHALSIDRASQPLLHLDLCSLSPVLPQSVLTPFAQYLGSFGFSFYIVHMPIMFTSGLWVTEMAMRRWGKSWMGGVVVWGTLKHAFYILVQRCLC